MPMTGGVGLGYALPFSGGTPWLQRFAQSAVSQFDPRLLLERGYNPLVDPLAPGGAERERQQREAMNELFMRLVRGNPEAAGVLAAGVPFARGGRVPKGFSEDLLGKALKQGKSQHLINQTASLDRPNADSAFLRDKYGVPIEAYNRPPQVERFMGEGDLSVADSTARAIHKENTRSLEQAIDQYGLDPHKAEQVMMDETGWLGRDAKRSEISEQNLDQLQLNLNKFWESTRASSIARQAPGIRLKQVKPWSLQVGDVLDDGAKVVKHPASYGKGTAVWTDQGRRFFRQEDFVFKNDWSDKAMRLGSAARQPWNLGFSAERALRAHFARHARRHQLPER